MAYFMRRAAKYCTTPVLEKMFEFLAKHCMNTEEINYAFYSAMRGAIKKDKFDAVSNLLNAASMNGVSREILVQLLIRLLILILLMHFSSVYLYVISF